MKERVSREGRHVGKKERLKRNRLRRRRRERLDDQEWEGKKIIKVISEERKGRIKGGQKGTRTEKGEISGS
jgi:hypothetical protein